MPKLIIMSPDGEPRTIELEDSATIGRAPECSVRIEEAACSRRHCQVLKIASGFELVDLKSRNGTKVNGVKRNRHVLSDGDVIEIGDTRVTFRDREGAEEEVILEDFGRESEISTGGDCYLVYADGDRKGNRIPLSGDRVTFGRKDSNSVTLKDAMASSYHCEITREGGGYVLRDLGSTNGTVVNGEPVSETTLGHGARVRIGRTRFVFVDPAVADFEQAMAKEEEAESEWGLMRAQVDMARVKRARRASLVWLLLFVVVIGGGAFVFLTQPELVKKTFGMEETVLVREVPDNMIDADDFSFEAPRTEWVLLDDETGDSRVGRHDAHQGSQSLLLSGPAEGTAAAVVEFEREFAVVPGTRYEVSAWVKPASAEAVARAGVVWLGSRDDSVRRYSLTPAGGAGQWSRVSRVLTVPPRAEMAKVVLSVAGPGTAFFDDVALRQLPREEGGARGAALEKSGFSLILASDGSLAVEKTGRFLLWNGGVALLLADGRLVTPTFRFEGGEIERDGGGATVRGEVRLPDGGAAPVRIAVAPADAGFSVSVALEEAVEGVAAAGLGFAVSRSYLSEGATLSGAFEAIEVQTDTRAEGTEKVILGGSDARLSLVAEGGAVFRMDPSEEGLRFAMLGISGAGEQKSTLIVDFSAQRNEAQGLMNEALGLRRKGRLGEAIRLYSKVVNEYPFANVQRNQARQELDTLLAEGESRLEAARGIFGAARDFYDLSDLGVALDRARKTAADYEGHEIAKAAGELAAEITEALRKEGEERQQAAADRLEARALDFEGRGQNRLAEVFWRRIVEEYPDTPAAERARSKLN